jgi:S1-C subfamily serine protease
MPDNRTAFWNALKGLVAVTALCGAVISVPAAAQQNPAKEQDAAAQKLTLDDMIESVVRIKVFVDPDARTAQSLGHERDGSGIVIDSNGLVLTIGYLMVEAHAAEIITNDGRKVAANIVGYDHDTGFGLLQAAAPLKLRPIVFGKAADLKVGEPVIASSFGGRDGTVPAFIAARREFAGSWEYLIDGAIFTTPAHSHWSGAALINREGKLVGVGSLIVGDVGGKHTGVAGNMYVPIDLLPPILADLIADGRAAGKPKPWIGVNTEEVNGKLVVSRITPGSPADKFGMKRGDVILGVGGKTPSGLADLYRQIWSQGEAGVDVPIDFERDGGKQHLDIKSMNRLDHLRLKSTL